MKDYFKKWLLSVLFMVLCVSAVGGGSAIKAEAAATKIYNAKQLQQINNNLSGNYVLAANISLSSYGEWTPIGSADEPFTGTFNGNGYTAALKNKNFSR